MGTQYAIMDTAGQQPYQCARYKFVSSLKPVIHKPWALREPCEEYILIGKLSAIAKSYCVKMVSCSIKLSCQSVGLQNGDCVHG